MASSAPQFPERGQNTKLKSPAGAAQDFSGSASLLEEHPIDSRQSTAAKTTDRIVAL